MTVPYTVVLNDTLRLIAVKHSLRTWQDIYFHPDNAAFRALRPDPDLIFPDDVVMIPVAPAPPSPPPSPPPAPAPPVPPALVTQLIPLINRVLGQLPVHLIGIRPPTGVRFLDAGEQAEGTRVFSGSLDFTKILISDATGTSNRPFTVAVPTLTSGTFVVINAGTLASFAPLSPPTTTAASRTLVHELAHAWQSQHHSDPTAFMGNSVASQLGAILDVPGAKAAAYTAALMHGLGAASAAASAEDVSAYAYVPGKPFRSYAAEQMAQQVEDAYRAGTLAADPVVAHARAVAAHAVDPDNVTALSTPRFERKSTPRVKFPP